MTYGDNSLARRIAARLADHASAVASVERREWAQGMRAELDHVEGDGPALGFAAGAAWTSYRLRAGDPFAWLHLGRWGVAGLAAVDAVMHLGFLAGLLAPGAAAALGPDFGVAVLALGLLHLPIAWALLAWRPRVLAMLIAANLALNTFLLRGVGAAAAPSHQPFAQAVVIEEYVVAALLALALLFFWSAPRLLEMWRLRRSHA